MDLAQQSKLEITPSPSDNEFGIQLSQKEQVVLTSFSPGNDQHHQPKQKTPQMRGFF